METRDNQTLENATAGEILTMDRATLEDYAWRKTCECNHWHDEYDLLVSKVEHIFSIFEEIKSLTKFGKNPEK